MFGILTFSVPVRHMCTSGGNGLWGMAPGVDVTYDRVDARIYIDEDLGIWGHAAFHHDKDAHVHGLLYTDEGCEDGAREVLSEHPVLSCIFDTCHGSEQGMQEARMLDCDAHLCVEDIEDVKNILDEANVEWSIDT